MGSTAHEPTGLYGIEVQGGLPSRKRVGWLLAIIVIVCISIPAIAVIAEPTGGRIGLAFAIPVTIGVLWACMGRQLVSIHVHRSNDDVLWISGTSSRGDKITALVSDVERITGPPTRFSEARIEFTNQWSVTLQVHRNDASAFVERLHQDLPPDTRVRHVRPFWYSSFTKRFYATACTSVDEVEPDHPGFIHHDRLHR